MTKVMVLGASVSQVPLIQQAKAMGLHVIVVSRKGNYPGFRYADQAVHIDTRAVSEIARVALAEKVDGVVTTGTDVAVPALGKVNDTMQLCGVSYRSALCSTNKRLMKEAFCRHGVRTAAFRKVSTLQEARQAYLEFSALGSDVIFKAVDGGASKGIVKVTDLSQVEKAYQIVKDATHMDDFLVEQFLEGIEFGAQAFVYNGNIQFILPHGDLLFYGDTGVPIGHYVPYECPPEVREDIALQLHRCIEALGLNQCAINADFMLVNDQVYVLEIGARAGATCLPELVSTYFGFNYYEQMVRVSLGMPPEFRFEEAQPCVCELITSDVSGQIVAIENTNADDDDIVNFSMDVDVGDRVSKFRVGTDRIGQIVVKGERLEEAFQRMEQFKRGIKIQIQADE